MADESETRKIGIIPETQKTRLVRRSDDSLNAAAHPAAAAYKGSPKTRLAFRPKSDAHPPSVGETLQPDDLERPVTGWLVVVNGPGRGSFAPIFDGMNSVGRGDDQATQLDFGDDTISRSEHAFITYDYMNRKFHIQHGGKASIVRLNDSPVLQPMELKSGDTISLGQTVVRFVAFCGEAFDWQD
ncbi:MAG: FHA domain-containing protein [Beijerinckiaceae bacterium]